MKWAWPVLMLAVSAGSAFAEDYPEPVARSLDRATTECAGFENGTVTVEAEAIQRIDLTGNGDDDWVVDTHHMQCSSAASMFCGTGGCAVDFIVGDTVLDALSKGWEIVPFGQLRVLLLQIHGSECGGTNLNPCVEALVWDPGKTAFSTLREPGE